MSASLPAPHFQMEAPVYMSARPVSLPSGCFWLLLWRGSVPSAAVSSAGLAGGPRGTSFSSLGPSSCLAPRAQPFRAPACAGFGGRVLGAAFSELVPRPAEPSRSRWQVRIPAPTPALPIRPVSGAAPGCGLQSGVLRDG